MTQDTQKPMGDKNIPVVVDMRGVFRVGARPPFIDYLVSLWNYRHFIFYDARARVRSGNTRDRLGSAWLILDPLLNGLGYLAIFGLLLGAGRGIDNYIGFLIIGVFMFQMSSRAIVSGARAIHSNRNVVQAFSFPRAALPIAANLRELLANIPVVAVMLLLIIVVEPVEPLTWRWLLILPVILLQLVFNLGASLLLAPLVARISDFIHVLSLLMKFWLFASCVMFSIDRYDSLPAARAVVEANPLYLVLSIVRDSVLYGQTPAWQSWAGLAAWALGAFCLGMAVFWRGEESYGREH